MATKRLARTVIEGGRRYHNSWERRHSHRAVRADELAFARDPTRWDDDDVRPATAVRRDFRDKLAPLYRWLRSNVGRPWDDVRSELLRLVDTRTIAGRHIVYDHAIAEVEESWRWRRFAIDDRGVLRPNQRPRFQRRKPIDPSWIPRLRAWTQGRRLGRRGRYWFWFVPARRVEIHCRGHACPWPDCDRRHALHRVGRGYRQDRQLTDAELAFWLTAPARLRTDLIYGDLR